MAIAVLMSTYNGEKYVKEQINSIISQNLRETIHLYIRDDGSSDDTIRIIEKYASDYGNIIFINRERIDNVGIQKSFLSLLEYAFNNSENNYFAFADQDDVWLSDKLSAGLQKIEAVQHGERGILYYSNKTFTDEMLNVLRKEDILYYDDIFEMLWKNLASGCTMIFDRNLAEICLKYKPETTILHDSWVYHIAKLIGSVIVFDKESYILYRQHGNNTVGIEGAKLYHSSIMYMLKRAVPVLFLKRNHTKQRYIEEVYLKYGSLISEQNRKIVENIIKYRFNPMAKFKLIHNQFMKKRDRKTRMVWRYSILFNRI